MRNFSLCVLNQSREKWIGSGGMRRTRGVVDLSAIMAGDEGLRPFFPFASPGSIKRERKDVRK